MDYVPASKEARNEVIAHLEVLVNDGGRSDEEDARLQEVIHELRCLNEIG